MESTSATNDSERQRYNYIPDIGSFAEFGMLYEQEVAALVSLQSLSKFDNFCLINNPPGCAPFDDIVLCTEKENRNVIYLFAVHCKLKPTVIIDDEFGNSSLHKKNKIKSRMNLDLLYGRYLKTEIKRIIPEAYRENCRIKIIFYTNRPLDKKSEIFETDEAAEFTNTQSKAYKLTGGFIKSEGDNDKRDFLMSINLYAGESRVHDNSICCIKKMLDTDNLNIVEVVKAEYLNCVRNWCNIKSRKEGLTKEFCLKLYTYAVLKDFVVPMNDYDEYQFKKYQDAFNNSDLLLWKSMKNKNLRVNSEHIQYVLGNLFKDVRDLHIESESRVYCERIIITDELKRSNKKEHLQYLIACFLEKNPFIVRNFNLKVKYKFTVILIDSTDHSDSLKIERVALNLIKEIIVTTRSGQDYKLEDVIDERSEVSVSDLLSLIINDRVNLNEHLVSRKVQKVLFDKKIFSVDNEIFIIISNGITPDRFIEYFEVDKEIVLSGNRIILTQSDPGDTKIESKLNAHFLKLSKTMQIEWMRTRGTIENIKKYRLHRLCQIIENELSGKKNNDYNCECCAQLEEINNPFIVISGVPGIGKTTFLKQFVSNARTKNFILSVPLRDHYDYYEHSIKSTAFEHLSYFSDDENTIFKHVFAKKPPNETIILFDGFDEISPRYTQIVTKIIKEIEAAGYNIILTTRSVLQNTVENVFGTLAYSLTPFNKLEQIRFLDFEVETAMTFIKTDLAFFNIPLNLRLLNEVIPHENNYKIDLLNLYEKFVDYKLRIFCRKISNSNINRFLIERYHKYFSIRLLFSELPEYTIIEDTLNFKLEDFILEFQVGGEKVGILIGDVDEVFIHRSVASYFAAKWLLDIYNSNETFSSIKGEREFAQCVNEIITNSNSFPLIRTFFDLMINQNELHKAAVEGNYNYIKQALHNDIKSVKSLNIFNRTLLHTIILNNTSFYDKYTLEINKDLIEVLNLLLQNFKDILSKKDSSEISALNYIEKKSLKETPLKIVIHRVSYQYFVYCNRNFKLWEIFVKENLHRCEILQLLSVLLIAEKNRLSTIFHAAKSGRVSVIQQFRDAGINFDVTSNNKHLLHFAAEGGSSKIMELLNLKEQMNVRDGCGRSLMHYAIFSDNPAFIDSLKLKLELYDDYELSALHYAIIFNKFEIFKRYFTPSENTHFLIQCAAAFYVEEILEFLLINSSYISTIFHLVILTNSLINKHFTPGDKSNLNQKKFNHRCFDFLKFLLDNKFDIEGSDEYNRTALHVAAYKSNVLILKFLLNSKININKLDVNGNSALHYAVHGNCFETVEILIKSGAPLSENHQGTTVLHLAAQRGNLEILRLLTESIDVNKRNSQGDTALHHAVFRNHCETVKYLIEKGVDFNLANIKNVTPLDLARHLGHKTIASYLEEHNAISNGFTENTEISTVIGFATQQPGFLDPKFLEFYLEMTGLLPKNEKQLP